MSTVYVITIRREDDLALIRTPGDMLKLTRRRRQSPFVSTTDRNGIEAQPAILLRGEDKVTIACPIQKIFARTSRQRALERLVAMPDFPCDSTTRINNHY